MTALTRSFRRKMNRRGGGTDATDASIQTAPAASAAPEQAPVDIAPNDPLLAYFQAASEAVDIDTLELDSPALRELKAAGAKLAVPLVSQGELIGVLNLGPRMSEQDYSSDDHKLLDNLAAQAAPALRVGQLVREQEAEAATRQRFEQELEGARRRPPASGSSRSSRSPGSSSRTSSPRSFPTCPAGRSPRTTALRGR